MAARGHASLPCCRCFVASSQKPPALPGDRCFFAVVFVAFLSCSPIYCSTFSPPTAARGATAGRARRALFENENPLGAMSACGHAVLPLFLLLLLKKPPALPGDRFFCCCFFCRSRAKLHLAFWQRHGILTAQPIARMRDVEFTCELVAAMLDGLQNQKSIIGDLYKRYDDDFPHFVFVKPRFAETLEFCERVLGGDITGTAFCLASLFYSLFVAVYDVMYGLKANDSTAKAKEEPSKLMEAQQQLIQLSEGITDELPRAEYMDFYNATRQSTDKITQRAVRHSLLVKMIAPCFGK